MAMLSWVCSLAAWCYSYRGGSCFYPRRGMCLDYTVLKEEYCIHTRHPSHSSTTWSWILTYLTPSFYSRPSKDKLCANAAHKYWDIQLAITFSLYFVWSSYPTLWNKCRKCPYSPEVLGGFSQEWPLILSIWKSVASMIPAHPGGNYLRFE